MNLFFTILYEVSAIASFVFMGLLVSKLFREGEVPYAIGACFLGLFLIISFANAKEYFRIKHIVFPKYDEHK